ncbi:MAG: OsmC family protein [Bdellovibrionia bacterium]
MVQYPLKFAVSVESPAGIQAPWTTKAEAVAQNLTAAIPPEFSGPGGGYSPEDFYALAVSNCFVATFKVFAEKSRLSFESVKVQSVLEVDRDEKGAPWMARITLNVSLVKPSSQENAQRILEKVKTGCLVLNSIRTEKIFNFQILD